MRYIVGYTADQRGAEAINLASALARTQGAQLDLVHVLGSPSPDTASYPQERVFQEILAGKADGWLDEGLALVPTDVPAQKHVHYADSFAEGLIEAARQRDAGLIVIGAARNGLFKRFTVGTVANALLHASPLPVALAPSGYQVRDGISRMSCAVGTREGAEALLDVALESTARRQVPLRLISLVSLDAPARTEAHLKDESPQDRPDDDFGPLNQARSHINDLLAAATRSTGTEVTAAVAHGSSTEEAIDSLDWDADEIVLIGSSRLAERHKIFLGTTANKMLRSLPVPMVVVPRDHVRTDRTPNTGTTPDSGTGPA